MLSRHWRLWLSFPSLALPPEERLALEWCGSSSLVPPESERAFDSSSVESTAADRAAADVRRGKRTPPPAYGGHLPFQGRLCREMSAVRLTEDKPLCGGVRCRNGRVYLPPSVAVDDPPPSAEGDEEWRKAATSYCFVPYGHEAVDGARLAAFRSPPPPPRAPTYKLKSEINVGRSRRLCQPP